MIEFENCEIRPQNTGFQLQRIIQIKNMKKLRIKSNSLFYIWLALYLAAFAQSQVKQLTTEHPLLPDPIKPSNSNLNNISPSMMEIFGNNQCRLPPTPTKLAIATVTRFRANGQDDLKEGIEFFKQYLRTYATMECDVFDSIYLIWNNDKAPEEYPTLMDGKENWRKNVYFIHTKFNSMNHRFAFPPWVPEQVFMTLDDDAHIDCENMRKAFTQWQDHFVGGLGPFGTLQMSSRTMQYKMQQDKFEYKYGTKSYLSMALPNIGIIPRHFYDLYYANLPQFDKMRNFISQLSNCDDIGLNFMIGYIYPQMRPIVLKSISAYIRSFKIQINKTPTHGQKRNDCLNKFTQILGENTWSYNLINRNDEYERIKQDPLRKYQCLLALKRSIIEQKYVNNDHYYNFMKNIYLYNHTQLSQQLVDNINSDRYVFSLTDQVRNGLVGSKKIDLRYRPRHGMEDMFGKQQVVSVGNSSLQSTDNHQIKFQNKVQMSDFNVLQKQLQRVKTTLKVGIILIMILIISVIFIPKLIQSICKSTQKKSGQIKLDNFDTDFSLEGQIVKITQVNDQNQQQTNKQVNE